MCERHNIGDAISGKIRLIEQQERRTLTDDEQWDVARNVRLELMGESVLKNSTSEPIGLN